MLLPLLHCHPPRTAVIGVVVAIDPAVALPVQAICSYLAAANSGYCSTRVRLLVCTSKHGPGLFMFTVHNYRARLGRAMQLLGSQCLGRLMS